MNDGHHGLGQAPACVDVGDGPPRAEHHEPLNHGGEEEEGEGDANDRVNNAKGLPAVGQRCRVTVACGGKGKYNPQVSVTGERKQTLPNLILEIRSVLGFFFSIVIHLGSGFRKKPEPGS